MLDPSKHDARMHRLEEGELANIYLLVHGEERVVAKWYASSTRLPQAERCFARELECLRSVSHPKIIAYLGDGVANDRRVIFVEHMPGGDLLGWMDSRESPPTEDQVRGILRQILKGIDALHRANVIHRDVKCENVLLESDADHPKIKICDFGLSKLNRGGEPISCLFCGTAEYAAPELWRGCAYDASVDIWSFGVLAFALLTGLHPFGHTAVIGARAVEEAINSGIVTWPHGRVSDLARDFVSACLQVDPVARADTDELKHHDFFASS
jgi:serine/threonine protein kinase